MAWLTLVMVEEVEVKDEAMAGDMVVDAETITMDDQSKEMKILSLMRSLTSCHASNESGSLLGMLQPKEKRIKTRNQELLPQLVLGMMMKTAALRKKVMVNLLIIACQARWDGANCRENPSAGSKGQFRQVPGEWEWCLLTTASLSLLILIRDFG